jgi:hypothetical protein
VFPYFLKHKHEAFDAFKAWKVMVEKQTERKINVLRTDNGMKFCSNEFKFFCREEGIVKQIPGIDSNDVFSPIVKHSSIHALHGTVAMHDLELEQLDVKTAFLHGDLEEEIYMDQSKGFIVCKLMKSLYGLKQSPRKWYKKFDSFIIANGFKRSLYDSCVYIKFVDGSSIYLLLYVDNMLNVGKSKIDIANLMEQLSSEFEMKDLGTAKKILV